MYHATKRQYLASIVKNGFKLSTGGLLGPGIYLSRDINKTRAYGDVCLKVLVYTGKTVKVHSADNQGSWRQSFDSAFLPPNNNVVASGFEETCVKSSKQVKILGIAFGHHQSGLSGGVRNLEGTNDELDREERLLLEKMVKNLSLWGKCVDMFALPLVLAFVWMLAVAMDVSVTVFMESATVWSLAVVWMLAVAMDVPVAVLLEDVIVWFLEIVWKIIKTIAKGAGLIVIMLWRVMVVLFMGVLKMVSWIVCWPFGCLATVVAWPASVAFDVSSKAVVLSALLKLVKFIYHRIVAYCE